MNIVFFLSILTILWFRIICKSIRKSVKFKAILIISFILTTSSIVILFNIQGKTETTKLEILSEEALKYISDGSYSSPRVYYINENGNLDHINISKEPVEYTTEKPYIEKKVKKFLFFTGTEYKIYLKKD